MHYFQSGETSFNYNSDLSGDVEICTIDPDTGEERQPLRVPGDALLAFVANHMRNEKIGELEQASVETLLGLK